MPDELIDELFPYRRDAEFHPLACLFFNMPFLQVNAETAHALAAWVFDSLDCSGPGAGAEVKYDALGGSGAPHETGRWIKRDADRVEVEVTTPDVVLTDKSEAELAQIVIDAEAALNAHRARTVKGV